MKVKMILLVSLTVNIALAATAGWLEKKFLDLPDFTPPATLPVDLSARAANQIKTAENF